jgi:hypothetical protein
MVKVAKLELELMPGCGADPGPSLILACPRLRAWTFAHTRVRLVPHYTAIFFRYDPRLDSHYGFFGG